MFPGGGDPFGMMNQMNGMMNQMLQDPFFGMPPPQAPPQNYQQYPQTAPRIEEVPHDAAPNRSSGAYLVEEPDDGAHGNAAAPPSPQQHQETHPSHSHNTQPRSAHPQQPPAGQFPPQHMQQNPFGGDPMGGMFGGLLGGLMGGMMMPPMPPVGAGGAAGAGQQGPQVFSYSSSSVMRAGPDGVYHSSTTSRQAPGGVRETQKTIRDGRTGAESMTIARGMGQQERVITRTRDANGQLITEEHHRGIDPSSAHQFDQQWTQRAQQTMPQWMQERNSTQRIGPGGMQQQQQLALPPAGAAAAGVQQQYGGQQQQQQQQGYYQQGGAGGYVQQQQGGGHGRQQQAGRGGGGGVVNGTGWPGGYHA